MEKILSQDEINALFSNMSAEGVVDGEAAAHGTARERNVTKYDFYRSDLISKEQIRAIHGLHTNFARNLTTSLSAYLRGVIEVTLLSVDQISYQEFTRLLSDPTLFCGFSVQPMHGNLAMELSPSVAFPAIDMLLGGTGNSPSESRTLTEIEMQIAEGVIKLALRDLEEAWRPIMEINPKLEKMETKPQMMQLVAPGEAVVAIPFDIKMGEQTGRLHLCIPSVIMKMNRAIFEQQRHRPAPEGGGNESEKIGDVLRGARVGLTSEIHDHALVLEDVLRISVGDIVMLNHAVDDPVQLNIGGIAKFCGRIVARRGKRAFEISHPYQY